MNRYYDFCVINKSRLINAYQQNVKIFFTHLPQLSFVFFQSDLTIFPSQHVRSVDVTLCIRQARSLKLELFRNSGGGHFTEHKTKGQIGKIT